MIKRHLLAVFFAIGLVLGLGATAAGAQTCSGSPQVCTNTNVDPTTDPDVLTSGLPDTEVAGKQQLPVTGAESAALAVGGTLLVLAGGAMVWRSNRATA